MADLLIIDDDPKICQFLAELAQGWGHSASHALTLAQGGEMARNASYDLVLLDLDLPDGNGLQLLPLLQQNTSCPEVIIITGTGDLDGARMAFKYGAWDYVQKPFTAEEVWLPITRALAYRKEKTKPDTLVSLDPCGIIGSSAPIRSCLNEVARAAATDASTLITGETGTGKELFARAIHRNSKRAAGSFTPIDCGAIPETLAEGIFFGYEKGAYTGAQFGSKGIIRQAEGGTLFLDEIADLPPSIQRALLRALQEKTILPLGGSREQPVNFRLVAATNRDLNDMVTAQTFRKDLLYRIRAIEIHLPPLRERPEDIHEIVLARIQLICQQAGVATKGVAPDFLDILKAHAWPGNVRELINVLEFSLASAGQDPTLHAKHLPPDYRLVILSSAPGKTAEKANQPDDLPFDRKNFPKLAECRSRMEENYLRALIRKSGGNREQACKLSGLSQARLYGLLKEYNLSLRARAKISSAFSHPGFRPSSPDLPSPKSSK